MDKEVLFHQIIEAKPYHVSIPKMFALGLSIIIIGILSAQIHPVLSIAMPLYIIAAILSMLYHNIAFSFSLIFTTADWSDNFSFISVQTKMQQPQKQFKVFKPLLKKIHRGSQGDILFNLRGKMYSCNRSGVKEINDADRLKMLEVENLDKYSKVGLQGENLTKSKTLFGKSIDLFEPNIFAILSRFFCEQTGWIFASFLALIAGIVFSLKRNENLIVLLHTAIHTLAFVIVFIQMCFRKYYFHSFYKQLSQKMYYVIREGKEIRVNLSDLLIGDIVRVKFQDQQKEMMVYFKGVLLCNEDLEVKQGKQGKQAFKKPLKDCKHLEQLKRRQRHTLNAGTRIANSLKQEYVNILVTDRTLSNNFKYWFDKPHQREYEPITKRIQIQKIKLLLAGSGLLVGFYLLSCVYFGRKVLQGAKSLDFTLLCAAIPVCFILNQLVILMAIFRMNYNQITLLQSDLQKVSFCPKIFLDDFKRELNFKFSELLYKNKILKFKNEDFKPDLQAMRAASSYDSQLALIMYISFGNFEKQFSFLGKTFQKFQKQYQFDVSQSQTLVIHKSSNKKWSLQKTFPLDERGMRSWLVQFDNKATYLISQLNEVNDSIFNLLCNKQDSNKKDRYADEARLQSDQGKQIKAMFFRNFKNQQLRGSIASEIDLKKEPRQNLQIRFQFGTLLVFDNSLPESISIAINQIKKDSIKGQILVEPIFLTSEGNEGLQGLEHYLPGVPIRYNCSSKHKEKQIRQSISKYGTVLIGNTDHNYELHTLVDFAGQLTKSSETNNFPTDVMMKSMTQILDLLSYSRCVLQSKTQNIKLVFFFVLFNLIGEFYTSHTLITRSQTQQIKHVINLVILTIFASILRQLLSSRPSISKHMRNITIFSPNFYISLLSTICSGLAWIALGLQKKMCQNQKASFSQQSMKLGCMDINQLLGGWAAILFFCVFYSEQSWIIGEDWGRLLITPLWLLLIYLNNVGLNVCLRLLVGILVVLGLKNIWRLSKQYF